MAAEGNSSLSDSKPEEQGQQELAQLRATVQMLTKSLAESNAEAEVYRRKFTDLQLRMEALGLASANKDRAKLEQRLLTAVSDLQLAQKERDESRDQMLRLSETMLQYLKTAEGGDAQARMEVETQLRRANAVAAPGAGRVEPQPSLLDGSVISVKDEWSFVVGNFGAQQGVKLGMPLRVKRGDDVVALLRVVDVREPICGAVLESGKGKIKIGDRLEVDARREVSAR